MGLLVVQILDAVFDVAQKDVGLRQRVRRGFRHEFGLHQPQQSALRRAGAQFGKLSAAHHLQ